MAKKKSTKNIVKRVRTWKTKSGEIKQKTYYYEKTTGTRSTKSGKQTKQTFKSVKVKSRKATIDSVEKAKEYFKSKSISLGSEKAQIILNEIRDGKTFTTQQIDRNLEKSPLDRDAKDVSNLLRALGYSKDEFLKELNINEGELMAGKFEKIGNDIRFTSATGNIIYFEWDYDAGFIQR